MGGTMIDLSNISLAKGEGELLLIAALFAIKEAFTPKQEKMRTEINYNGDVVEPAMPTACNWKHWCCGLE
eukprot:11725729-Ditylum_brightwellii.AAC.1